MKMDEWQTHVMQWQQTTLNQTEYCRQQGLKLSSFNKWCHRMKATKVASRDFVEVSVGVTSAAPELEIKLSPDGGLSMAIKPAASSQLSAS